MMLIKKIVILGLISVFMNDHVCLGMKGLTGGMRRLNVSSQRPNFSSVSKFYFVKPSREKILRNLLLAGGVGGAGLALYKAPDYISGTNEHKDDPLFPIRIKNKVVGAAEAVIAKWFIIFAITGNVSGIKYLAGKLSYDCLLAGLYAAIVHKQEKIANLLLEQYGEKGTPDFLAVGLRYAVDTGQEKLVEFLLKKGADSHHIYAQRVDGSMFNSPSYDLDSRMMDAVDIHMAVSYDSLFLLALEKHYFKIARLLVEYETEKNRNRYQRMLEEAEAKFALERAS